MAHNSESLATRMTEQGGKYHSPRYDVHTAVTFLIAGLGIGSILTLLLSTRNKSLSAFVRNPATVHPNPAL